LSGSECLFLCVESKALQSGGRKDNNKIAHLGMWTKDLPTVPLVILVTKADEFELPGQGPDPGPATAAADSQPGPSGLTPLPAVDPALEELAHGKFRPWFEGDRIVMICPVSVMEKDPYFLYLPAPFAFAAYHIVQAKHAEKTRLLELNDGDLKKRTEGVGYFWYYFGQKTTRELRDKIRKDREALALLQEKMASLEKYFAKASVYHKGTRVTLSGQKRQASI
jgi:hypothetical protein